jgi:hypothetical protein
VRTFTNDEVFEILILKEVESRDTIHALLSFLGRAPTPEELKAFEKKIYWMHEGWCRMNRNIRRLGKP